MQRRRQQRKRALTWGPIAAAVALIVVFATIAGGGDKKKTVNASDTNTTVAPGATAGPPKADPLPAGEKITGDTPCPKADGTSPRTTGFAKAPPLCINPAKTYQAVFDTSEGTVTVNLDVKTTPGTSNNFVVLSRYHYYDGTAIHRIDTSIDILQGGSPNSQNLSDPGPGYTIKDEGSPPRHYAAGDLVMARSSGPDSGGAQFFFVVGSKASALDSQGTYVTFAKVDSGLDVLQKVEALFQECPAGDQQCLGGAPSRVVTIKTVTIKES
jgi:cyclophilin family peptidyl-prolyl cis-trans isomerase